MINLTTRQLPRTNKLGAIRTEYNGIVFDSKKEAAYANRLELLKHANTKMDRVLRYDMQVPYEIILNGKKICKYILDFKVQYADRVEYIDVKGYKKGATYALFSLKKKLVEAQYGINITEV